MPLRLLGLVLALSLTPLLGSADEPKAKKDDKPAAPAAEFQALLGELQKAQADARKNYSAAKNEDEKEKISDNLQKLIQSFPIRFLAFAQKYPKDEMALHALAFVVMRTPKGPALDKAVDLLVTHHLDNTKLGDLCRELGDTDSPGSERLLRSVRGKAKNADVVAGATFGLGKLLKAKSESLEEAERATAAKEAETLLAEVVEKYGKVGDLAESAKGELFMLRNLTIGKVAPDIEGDDADGKKFKLSDYRGKVVVLDFWAGWCGPCMAMVPHERGLVKRLEGKPFALVGVNLDNSRKDLKQVEDKNQMSWRSFFDGREGPIGKQWQIQYIPMIYVLDTKGVIRFKGVRDQELDKAVDALLKEVAEKKPGA